MERFGRDPRRARPRRRPGAADPTRLRAPHASTCTRARRCSACSTSASCRSSTRTTPSPTTRSATATTTASPRSCRTWSGADAARAAHRHRRALHRRPAPRRACVAHRGDRRGRRRARTVAGGAGTARGSGGMASKLAAAKIAAWSGVRVVIAAADAPGVVADAIAGRAGRHRDAGRGPSGSRAASCGSPSRSARPDASSWTRVRGARSSSDGRSLLPAGVRGVEGDFDADDAVEIVADGERVREGSRPLRRGHPAGASPGAGRVTSPRGRRTR